MNKKMKKITYILIPFILVIGLYSLNYLESKKPIKIGLMVTLTGVYPDLGREIRDGALMAVEMINEKGGINGRNLKIIIKDNRYNIDVAKRNYEELYEENVIAVIGPATSTTAKRLLAIINEKKLLAIAPTPTSTELSGLDDYMIRLRPTNREEAVLLADYVIKNLKIKSIAIIYDVTNPAYTTDFINYFKLPFKKNLKIYIYPFDESKDNIKKLSIKIIQQSVDAVVIIMDVYNTSLFAQNLRLLKADIPILTTMWAISPRLIEYGGKSIEGIIFADSIEFQKIREENEDINNKFIDRFGRPLSSISVYGYDSVMIIKRAIEEGATRENIKDVILKIKKFKGLQGEIIFDEFGDIQKKSFILKFENGKFRKVEL